MLIYCVVLDDISRFSSPGKKTMWAFVITWRPSSVC